jgi:hypothetical protein
LEYVVATTWKEFSQLAVVFALAQNMLRQLLRKSVDSTQHKPRLEPQGEGATSSNFTNTLLQSSDLQTKGEMAFSLNGILSTKFQHATTQNLRITISPRTGK